ncbi:MAG TPA: DUF1186 domain-containing protein [Chthonomonadaceae bacterium]|nr:DUF1186 domain-containing protein [Chthonomonadaceae bacterium]
MSRHAARRPEPRPKPQPVRPPNLPQHNHAAPYSRLLTLGEGEYPEVYAEIEAELRRGDTSAAIATLLGMALDESYYEYYEERINENDPRVWTRLHTVRVLARFGPEAQVAIEPLLPLLNEEDDSLREEMPFVYAAFGEAALEPLIRQLNATDADPWLRIGAGESLAELGEAHPELRARVVAAVEQALLMEKEDEMIRGYLITNLLDLGAREALPIIQQAFEEGNVDETLVQMADVEEHFDLPRVTPRKSWNYFGEEDDEEEESGFSAPDVDDEEDDAPQTPYVAPVKVGRNDPCPCGSGKKFKKCHGA